MRFVWIALLLVVAAGGVLRFNAASTPTAYQSKDERSYALLAKEIIKKKRYGVRGMEDPVHWVPGAPILFATAYYFKRTTAADQRRPDVPSAYPWQAGVGTLVILATFAFGLVLAGRIAGLLAATAVAFYPPFIFASKDLLSEPLGALLATLALTMTVLAIRNPGRVRWKAILAGLLFAATVLTRADLALLPLVAAAAIFTAAWIARRDAAADDERVGRWQRARSAAFAVSPFLIALVLAVLPWTLYASKRANTFVPLSNGGGSNLFIGTYLPGDGKLFGAKKALAEETKQQFPELRSVRGYFQIRSREVIRTVALRRPELSEEAALKAEGLANLRRYALGQPFGFAGMMASKVWRLWGGYSVGSNRVRSGRVQAYHLALLFASLGGLIAGLVLTRRRVLLLPLGALLYVSALNAILVSESRHNMTLIPTLACGGAAGAAFAVRHLRARREQGVARDPVADASSATVAL